MSQPELMLVAQPIYLTKQHWCEPIALYKSTSPTRLTGLRKAQAHLRVPHAERAPTLTTALCHTLLFEKSFRHKGGKKKNEEKMQEDNLGDLASKENKKPPSHYHFLQSILQSSFGRCQ